MTTSESSPALRSCVLRLLVQAADNATSNTAASKGELHMTWQAPGATRLRPTRLSGAMDPGMGFTGTLPEMLNSVAHAMSTDYGQLICRTILGEMQGHTFNGIVLIASAMFWDRQQASLVKPALCLIGIGVRFDTGQQQVMTYNLQTRAMSEEVEQDLAEVTELVWSLAETMDNMRNAPMPENAFDIAAELLEAGITLHLGAGRDATVGPSPAQFSEHSREWFLSQVGTAARAAGIQQPKPSRKPHAVITGDPKTVVENFTKPQPDSTSGPVRYRN